MDQDAGFRNVLRVSAGTLGILTVIGFLSFMQELHSSAGELNEHVLLGTVLFGVCGIGSFGLMTFRNWGRQTVILSLLLYIPWRLGSLLRVERIFFKNVMTPNFTGSKHAPNILAEHVFHNVVEELITTCVVLGLALFLSSRKVKHLCVLPKNEKS